MRPGDVLNLRDELAEFLGLRELRKALDATRPNPRWSMTEKIARALVSADVPDKVFAYPERPDAVDTCSTDELNAIATEFQKALVVTTMGEFAGRVKSFTSFQFRKSIFSPIGNRILVVTGPLLEVACATLCFLLRSETAQRLRRCPECDTLFFRVRKQLYCSRHCVNAANMRAWRKTSRGRRKSRDNSRNSYVRLRRAQLGPKVKVGVRTRKED
jgi:hypothetical protein